MMMIFDLIILHKIEYDLLWYCCWKKKIKCSLTPILNCLKEVLIYEVCSKSIRPFSLSPIRYEQTARAKRGCTHTHSRVIMKRFRPIRHSYLSV